MHIFGMLEEAEIPGEKPHRHENTQTHRNAFGGRETTRDCVATMLTTARRATLVLMSLKQF